MIEGLFQPLHLLVILGIALFVFGPRRLPELGKGIGDGIRTLKEGLREVPAKSVATLLLPTNRRTRRQPSAVAGARPRPPGMWPLHRLRVAKRLRPTSYYNPGTPEFEAFGPLGILPQHPTLPRTGWGLRCGDDGPERGRRRATQPATAHPAGTPTLSPSYWQCGLLSGRHPRASSTQLVQPHREPSHARPHLAADVPLPLRLLGSEGI